ncbi:MAG: PEP/pyruvate-binding domain-containing protein, partial [Burkholderiaceae bacterium]|nr:PEP/pyruvate-binding domain-containing protein [Burkholderiaceae bacterium]
QLYAASPTAERRLFLSAELLMHLRNALPGAKPGQRLAIVDLSLAVELDHFNAAGELHAAGAPVTRRQLIERLRAGNDAAYGTGLIGRRQYLELDGQLSQLNRADAMTLAEYLPALRTAGLLPGWGAQSLNMQFGEAMAKLVEIEPKAALFVQDQVRGSPLLAYSRTIDALSRDANRLAGVQHKLLGQEIGAGFNALNPGLARGVLHAAPDMKAVDAFRADGIYLLPETVSDLPPLAGILTAGAGNPLSHVQLLARNLGIPNVAVDASLLSALQRNDGRRIVLAVSRAGLVEINEDSPQWDSAFGKQAATEQNVMFEPDVAKLDLTKRDFISLRELRAADSGRLVGPKAAKLGELMSHFPDRVAPGVGIPFGLYREAILERPYKGSSQTVYQWMVQSFRQLEAMPPGSAEAARFSEQLRAEIYSIVSSTDPGPRFRERLRAAMTREFGTGFNGGVFIRSDTNVEDLPGFTGAGLNLTLFNVVGFDNIVKGISEVWASPYTARAWAWRQSHMKGPEHVYPAVLLLRTVPADKSGVMITQDVDNADPGKLSVAVNEGVGGAVDGQAAESLRVDRRSGKVRLLAVATAPRRLVPLPTGGIARRPTSGADTLLQPDEIAQLIAFADEIPRQFPQLGENGKPVAADVEFAFVDGKMWLLQIRPFNESRQARGASHLAEMDRSLAGNLSRSVNLQEAVQ